MRTTNTGKMVDDASTTFVNLSHSPALEIHELNEATINHVTVYLITDVLESARDKDFSN